MNETYEVKNEVEEKILKVYRYGSRVYGTHHEDSDFDFIFIVESDGIYSYDVHKTNMNIKVWTEKMFIQMIDEHRIDALECIFQDKDNDPYVKYFELNKSTLRKSISYTSSHSFVKAKKKIKQGDYYIGKKSLFHSIRIISFGIQIALTGKIVNYKSCNEYYKIIMGINSSNWDDYSKILKPIYNSKKSDFKKFSPIV